MNYEFPCQSPQLRIMHYELCIMNYAFPCLSPQLRIMHYEL
ncbi:MAG: alpha/beta hydrolase [Bacteroidales bacterium]|nr:alpha/beta hydrolase [Bacteroidales bacterium]